MCKLYVTKLEASEALGIFTGFLDFDKKLVYLDFILLIEYEILLYLYVSI